MSSVLNKAGPTRVACVIGTRPEAIKLMPVVRALKNCGTPFEALTVTTGQHTDLLEPLLDLFEMRADFALAPVPKGISLDEQLGTLIGRLGEVFDEARADIVVVQGDTASALAGAIAAHHRKLKTVHVEAGLRSGNRLSPFPEEMNRRLITQLTNLHLAASEHNAETLRSEGIADARIIVTGNPVVDALELMRNSVAPSSELNALLDDLRGRRIITLTTHRRENFGEAMRGACRVIAEFVHAHEDVALVFPVHPNPNVREAFEGVFSDSDRVRLISPLIYPDFLYLVGASWLIASDSGGVQEEAPTLKTPLLILRENTERPEAIACGSAQLIGGDLSRLRALLDEAYAGVDWMERARHVENPFGDGKAGPRIARAIATAFAPAQSGRAGLEAVT